MKCEIGSPGELKKEFDVAGGQVCRLNAALAVINGRAEQVEFAMTNNDGVVDPDGSGTAEKTAPAADGRPCAQVTLQNGRSGNICAAPSR